MQRMRSRSRTRVVALCTLLPLAGCGTSHMLISRETPGTNTFENACNVVRVSPCDRIPAYFGGTLFDTCLVRFAVSGPAKGKIADPDALPLSGPVALAAGAVAAADIPMSLFFDAILLPATIAMQVRTGDACPKWWTPIPRPIPAQPWR